MSDEPILAITEIISRLKAQEARGVLTALAREINNHVYLCATFASGKGELTEQDMQVILTRLEIVLQTLRLSERGQGHEAFRPKPRVAAATSLNALDREITDHVIRSTGRA